MVFSSRDLALPMRKPGRLRVKGWNGEKCAGGASILHGVESLPKDEPMTARKHKTYDFEPEVARGRIMETARDGAIRACIVVHGDNF